MRSICWTILSRFASGRGGVPLGPATRRRFIPLGSTSCSTNAVVKKSTENKKRKVNTSSKQRIDVGDLFTKDITKSNWTVKEGSRVKTKRYLSKDVDQRKTEKSSLPSSDGKSDPSSIQRDHQRKFYGYNRQQALLSKALEGIYNKQDQKDVLMEMTSKMAKFTGGNQHLYKQAILIGGLRILQERGSIIENEEFDDILTYFLNNYNDFTNHTLYQCVPLILTVFNPESQDIRDLLVNVTTKSMEKMTKRQLMNLNIDISDKQLKSMIESNCLEELSKRTLTITDTCYMYDILRVCQNNKYKDLRFKFENQITDLIDQMTMNNTVSLLWSFAKTNHRNMPIISRLIHHIQCTEELNITHIGRILTFCTKLAIFDEQLMTYISRQILSADLSGGNHGNKCFRILFYLSKLLWRQENLLSTLMNNLSNAENSKLSAFEKLSAYDKYELLLNDKVLTDDKLSTDDKLYIKFQVTLLSICCQLNFCPANVQLLMLDGLKMRDCDWLNYVWRCTVLQIATTEMMSSVLDKNFLERLKQEYNDDRLLNYKCKLININCASCFEIESYEGPHLSGDLLMEDCGYDKRRKKQTIQLAEDVVQCLNSFLPESEYYRKNAITSYGYKIDAELYVNNNGEAVKLQNSQESQEGLHRVALKVLGFFDTLQPEKLPTGPEAMVIRHLSCQGYTILLVPYYEWNDLKTSENKKQYLQNKIRSIIS